MLVGSQDRCPGSAQNPPPPGDMAYGLLQFPTANPPRRGVDRLGSVDLGDLGDLGGSIDLCLPTHVSWVTCVYRLVCTDSCVRPEKYESPGATPLLRPRPLLQCG